MTLAVGIDATKISDAYREWISSSIKNAETERFESGKFLFTVTSGSIGTLAAISKIASNSWGAFEWSATVVFLLSGAIALWIVLPMKHDIGPNTDLQQAHNEMVNRLYERTILWGIVWVIGVGLAAIGFSQ